jgi:Tol biopolymer transport system component
VDAARQESGHGHPTFLPDGRQFLYVTSSPEPDVRGIYTGSLDEPATGVRLVATDHKASYVASRAARTGHLLWLREQTLLAQAFDPATLRLDGDPVPVVADVWGGDRNFTTSASASFWTSETGVLAYRRGAFRRMGSLVWISRSGQLLGEASPEANRTSFRLSADGSRVAMGIGDDGNNMDVWTLDLGRQVATRVTFDPATDALPTWSPDGGQLAYDSNRSGIRQIYRTASRGGGEEEQLTTGPYSKTALDWSRDGRYLLYSQTSQSPVPNSDLWVLPLDGNRTPAVVLQTPFNEAAATFSPDGKWIAYQSNASGRHEIYVRPFPPGPGSPWQVSNQGGSRPRWGDDGKSLYFLALPTGQLTALMTTAVRAVGQRFEAGAPRELFQMESVGWANLTSPYDVTPDGQRFLVFQWSGETTTFPLTVVTDWRAALTR